MVAKLGFEQLVLLILTPTLPPSSPRFDITPLPHLTSTPSPTPRFDIPTRLIEFTADRGKLGTITTVEAVLDLACLLYTRAIRLQPLQSWLWHDIAYAKLLAGRNLSREHCVGFKRGFKRNGLEPPYPADVHEAEAEADAEQEDPDQEVLMHPRGGLAANRAGCHHHAIEQVILGLEV